MSQIKIIVVSGETVVANDILDISTTLDNNKYFLLTGIIYQYDMKPLPNAAVKVFRVDNSVNPPLKEFVGMTFSIEDGTYGISLLIGYEYTLIVYS